MVRINQGDRGLEDLEYVVPFYVNMILIPKVESAERIKEVDARISEIKNKYDIDYPIWYMPILESALGIENAYQIATASPNVAAMAIGLEDYTADIGVQRTNEGTESLYARMRMVNACKAAGIQPIDSVFSDVADMEGLLQNVIKSKALGFEGMGCIHPRQIAVIKEGFKPSEQELEKAKKIMLAFEKAKKEGKGVISLGTKMIDPPVVKRAEKTIALALQFGMLQKDWIEKEMNNNN
jgi:citrate lyase subunit beta/citryl-CoA lyase